jgi:hypothetical protein
MTATACSRSPLSATPAWPAEQAFPLRHGEKRFLTGRLLGCEHFAEGVADLPERHEQAAA